MYPREETLVLNENDIQNDAVEIKTEVKWVEVVSLSF